jgi:hypothetical protein
MDVPGSVLEYEGAPEGHGHEPGGRSGNAHVPESILPPALGAGSVFELEVGSDGHGSRSGSSYGPRPRTVESSFGPWPRTAESSFGPRSRTGNESILPPHS